MPVPSALTSRAPSAVLAGRQFLPAAGIGAVQGFLVAAVVQTAASYTWGEWAVFAGVCVVAGVAFILLAVPTARVADYVTLRSIRRQSGSAVV